MFLKPDVNIKSIYDIDLDELKSQGVKAMLFDLDSTIMASKSAKYTDEMYQLFHTIEDIAGDTFSNSIWGSIATIRMTIDQLGKLLDGIKPDDILIWVSSF